MFDTIVSGRDTGKTAYNASILGYINKSDQ